MSSSVSNQESLFGADIAASSLPLRSQVTLTCPSRFLHACVRAPSMTWWARNTWWGRVSSCVALIEADQISSMIFWGLPGVGKTTPARVIAHQTSSAFIDFSAL